MRTWRMATSGQSCSAVTISTGLIRSRPAFVESLLAFRGRFSACLAAGRELVSRMMVRFFRAGKFQMLTRCGALAALLSALLPFGPGVRADDFEMALPEEIVRPWIGRQYWSSPLRDWQLAHGRVESVSGGARHEVVLLTHQLKAGDGDLQMSVRLGQLHNHPPENGLGWAGFKFALTGRMAEEYRSALWKGRGISAGVTTAGQLFVGTEVSGKVIAPERLNDFRLVLQADCAGSGAEVMLTAFASDSDELLAVMAASVNKAPLMGNFAIACEPLPKALAAKLEQARPADVADAPNPVDAVDAPKPAGDCRFWFDDWKISGSKVVAHPEQTWGPILWTQYTVNDGVMKMTAHLAPVGAGEDQTVTLQLNQGGGRWKVAGTAKLDGLARTAQFRIDGWEDDRSVEYRVVYGDDHWAGTIRRNPTDQSVLRMAVASCMHDFAFPNQYIAQNMLAQDPDVVFFAGDQIYESVAGHRFMVAATAEDVPRATLDYLPKYWLFGWSFRELLKDRPSVIIPDDHDIYHGNIWGRGGERLSPDPEVSTAEGGYRMHPDWINMVQRTQVSHLPDPYDATPAKNGVGVFYTDLNWGGVSFAIVEDRKWKSAPGDVLRTPVAGSSRKDHITDPGFDTRLLDRPGLSLLGARQMTFLDAWSQDWRHTDLKAVLSATPFCAVATHHGGGGDEHFLYADLDANGWPQTPRDEALKVIRKAHAIMLHGDQHLATLVQHGVDDWGDSGWSYTAPGIANSYPRIWRPAEPGENRLPDAPYYTGDYLDGFKNKVTVWAAASREDHYRADYQPAEKTTLERLKGSGSGYGIVAFDRAQQEITVESWPVHEKLSGPGKGEQSPGWPMTLRVDDLYAREPVAFLPPVVIKGFEQGDRPLVRVVEEASGALVYARRISEAEFLPRVFAEGRYTVLVGEGRADDKKFTGVVATAEGSGQPLEVNW